MTARDSRRKQMAEYIDQKKSVEMDELCDVFAVSMNTVRADLAYLVSTGAVEKVYGGARSNLNHELHVFAQRTGLNQEAKSLIAKTAARRIFDKDIIYVDSGTTTMHLLEYLDPSENVTILTGNLHVVSQAYNMPNVEMIVLPGLMNRRTNALTDGSTLEFLGRFHFAKAFMGTSGVSESGKLNVGASGYTDNEFLYFFIRCYDLSSSAPSSINVADPFSDSVVKLSCSIAAQNAVVNTETSLNATACYKVNVSRTQTPIGGGLSVYYLPKTAELTFGQGSIIKSCGFPTRIEENNISFVLRDFSPNV